MKGISCFVSWMESSRSEKALLRLICYNNYDTKFIVVAITSNTVGHLEMNNKNSMTSINVESYVLPLSLLRNLEGS